MEPVEIEQLQVMGKEETTIRATLQRKGGDMIDCISEDMNLQKKRDTSYS